MRRLKVLGHEPVPIRVQQQHCAYREKKEGGQIVREPLHPQLVLGTATRCGSMPRDVLLLTHLPLSCTASGSSWRSTAALV